MNLPRTVAHHKSYSLKSQGSVIILVCEIRLDEKVLGKETTMRIGLTRRDMLQSVAVGAMSMALPERLRGAQKDGKAKQPAAKPLTFFGWSDTHIPVGGDGSKLLPAIDAMNRLPGKEGLSEEHRRPRRHTRIRIPLRRHYRTANASSEEDIRGPDHKATEISELRDISGNSGNPDYRPSRPA